MQITAPPIPFYRAAGNRPPELSSTAAVRLKLLEQWRAIPAEGATAARAADILRVPRANLYRWRARLDERGLRSLEPGSRRPSNSRKPQRDPALVKAVLALRKKPPCYGKDKIAVELRKDGWGVSASMAGRILADAKRRGTLREPPRPGVRPRNPRPKRPYAVRKPKDYRPARPGDLVQVDTLDVRPLPGVILKHFTARDVVSRCDVLQVGTQATSASAARFLDAIVARMPFPVKAIQVDGGSESRGRSRRRVGARRLAVRRCRRIRRS